MDWNQLEIGVFLVNLLGIIYDPSMKLILIGRRQNDPHVSELTWVFPGGRPNYSIDLEGELQTKIKTQTGLSVRVDEVIYAKTYPEKKELLSIYYKCEPVTGDVREMVAAGSLVELKWVKPTDVAKYFTTSVHPKILEYLRTLE